MDVENWPHDGSVIWLHEIRGNFGMIISVSFIQVLAGPSTGPFGRAAGVAARVICTSRIPGLCRHTGHWQQCHSRHMPPHRASGKIAIPGLCRHTGALAKCTMIMCGFASKGFMKIKDSSLRARTLHASRFDSQIVWTRVSICIRCLDGARSSLLNGERWSGGKGGGGGCLKKRRPRLPQSLEHVVDVAESRGEPIASLERGRIRLVDRWFVGILASP